MCQGEGGGGGGGGGVGQNLRDLPLWKKKSEGPEPYGPGEVHGSHR